MRDEHVDIYEIRRANLRRLVEEHAAGSLSRFVETTLGGLTSYKGLQRVTGPKAKRNLGSATARQIEARLQLPSGWMDQDHSGSGSPLPPPTARNERILRLARSIESLPEPKRSLLEKLVDALGEPIRKGRPNRKSKP